MEQKKFFSLSCKLKSDALHTLLLVLQNRTVSWNENSKINGSKKFFSLSCKLKSDALHTLLFVSQNQTVSWNKNSKEMGSSSGSWDIDVQKAWWLGRVRRSVFPYKRENCKRNSGRLKQEKLCYESKLMHKMLRSFIYY